MSSPINDATRLPSVPVAKAKSVEIKPPTNILAFPSLEMPGAAWRPRPRLNTKVAYWIAPQWAREAGFTPTSVRLHGSRAEMAAICQKLHAEAHAFVKNPLPLLGATGKRGVPRFDGTFGSLIRIYRHDPDSPINRIRWNTRENYETTLNYLLEKVGSRRLCKINRRELYQWYREFKVSEDGTPALTIGVMRMAIVRRVVRFGVGEYPDCERLRQLLSVMTIEHPAKRRQFITAKMVEDFCREAHRQGYPSMALATALQFDTALRQKDVIGEWTPNPRGTINEPGMLSTRYKLWSRGLKWGEHIDRDLILTKPTSKTDFKKTACHDLKLCPFVLEQLKYIPAERRVGPVIISEKTNYPYVDTFFRKKWRKIARAAGIPDDILNLDNRSGAVTESSNAGVDMEYVRQFATHAEQKMTQHYNRDTLTKSQAVARARLEHRNAAPEDAPVAAIAWADLESKQ